MVSKKHLRYLELAEKISIKSDHPKHKIGGVLVKKSRIISVGFNQMKTHTKSPSPYKGIHCELDIIIGCSAEDMDGATLYLLRKQKDGSMAMSRPCKHCQKLLETTPIKEIYYTRSDNELGHWNLRTNKETCLSLSQNMSTTICIS